MTILGLNHAQITIPQGRENEARSFYCDVLGLNEIAKPESLAGRGGLWLAVGALQVHIGAEDGVDRSQTKAHLAYEVVGLAAWQERLAQVGLLFEDVPPIPGYARILFRDPFGNRVEFLERI